MPLGIDIVETLDRWGFEFKVSLPVVVFDVNEDKSLVRCEIAILRRQMAQQNREVETPEYIQLPEIPVAHYSTSKGYVWVDIQPETHGRIIFGDVDLQNYIALGETLEPGSTRFHDWNDSYFVPGEFSFARRIDPIDADVAISDIDGTTGVSIKDGVLNLFGDEIRMNGLPIDTINPKPPASFDLLPPNPMPPKAVRR